MTAPPEPALILAPQWDAMLGDIAALNDSVAEWADIQLAGGAPPRWVIARMITANRLIARAARREPVTL
jgi:hypothetical protein